MGSVSLISISPEIFSSQDSPGIFLGGQLCL